MLAPVASVKAAQSASVHAPLVPISRQFFAVPPFGLVAAQFEYGEAETPLPIGEPSHHVQEPSDVLSSPPIQIAPVPVSPRTNVFSAASSIFARCHPLPRPRQMSRAVAHGYAAVSV